MKISVEFGSFGNFKNLTDLEELRTAIYERKIKIRSISTKNSNFPEEYDDLAEVIFYGLLLARTVSINEMIDSLPFGKRHKCHIKKRFGTYLYEILGYKCGNKSGAYDHLLKETTLNMDSLTAIGRTICFDYYFRPPAYQNEWLKVSQAAIIAACSEGVIRKAVKENRLISSRTNNPSNRMIRIRRDELEAWIKRGFSFPSDEKPTEEKQKQEKNKSKYEPDDMLKLFQAAFELNVSETTIRKKVRAGIIPSTIKDGIYYVRYQDLMDTMVN